jgi:acetyl-CoA C-acetyltransferase
MSRTAMSRTGREAVIVAAARTPIGRAHKGSLTGVRPDDLLAGIAGAALARVPELAETDVEDLIAGCALPGGEQGFNIARIAALLLGFDHLPGVTVNRFCTSSLQGIRMAAHAIGCGEADAIIAAGVESQSRLVHGSSDSWPGTESPAFAGACARTAARARGELPRWSDPRHTGRHPDPYIAVGLAAENAADHYGITRAEMDAYAARSQQATQLALAAGLHEVAAVKTPDGTAVTRDDCPRAGVTTQTLAALPPRFRADGRVTAGNAAPLSDAAAAVIVMSAAAARERGIAPLARIVATAVSASSPEIEGPAPVQATRQVLTRAGMTLADMDVIVGNEPFAAQVLAYCAELSLDPARMNTLGGSIALGEAYGAAGARLTTTALHTLRHTGGATALISVVAAGGQGMAMILER